MKQKQLKQVIKENIKSILSESNNPTLEKIIVRFVKKYSKEWGLSMYDTFRGIQRKMDQMEDQFGAGEYDPQSRTYVSPKFTEPLGEDTQYAPRVDGDINEQEDDIEPTADDINKADSIASKGNKLQSLIKKMKSKAKEYKKAEGDKKESIKKELKKMTTEKNKLEASI